MNFVLCSLVIFSRISVSISEYMLCDEYIRNSSDSQNFEQEMMYTIFNYSFPLDRILYQNRSKIPCPCTEELPCIRKCCLPEDSIIGKRKICQPSSNEKRFNMQSVAGNYIMIVGSFCPSSIKSSNNTQIFPNSSVLIEGELLNMDKYCIDYFEEEGKFMILECVPPVYIIETVSFFETFCLLLSEFFLLITLIVYTMINYIRSLPGKILINYVISLFISDGFVAMLQILRIYQGGFCIFSAFVVQFSFLASFFWLNVMCFDLWWTFSGFRSFSGSQKERDEKKFMMYSLYAWGCPTLIVATTIFIENSSLIPDDVMFKPEIGTNKCFFSTNEAIFIYFYSFISIIVFSNLCMFISTTFTLKRHKKESRKVLKRDGSRLHKGSVDHDNKQRFSLYLKLFIIMGINWIMEVLSFYFHDSITNFWLVTDIGNTLQGVFIFIIFVCKPKVLEMINQKLCPRILIFKDTSSRNSSAISAGNLRSIRLGEIRSSENTEQRKLSDSSSVAV